MTEGPSHAQTPDTASALVASVLLCPSCGAPVKTPSGAGQYPCMYCGATIHVHRRATGPIRFAALDAGANVEQSEQARLRALRAQAAAYDVRGPYAYISAPDGLHHLSAMPETDPAFFDIALAAFRASVERCAASGGQLDAQRHVYWISRKLKNSCVRRDEPERARAVLETALDELTDPGYRQLLVCGLADQARRDGDLDRCAALLAQCDPHPPSLDVDTDYRTSLAMLHLMRGRPDEALAVVGDRDDALPFEPSSVFVVHSIRIAALEALGRGPDADRALESMFDAAARNDLDAAFATQMWEGSIAYAPARAVLARRAANDATRAEAKRQLAMRYADAREDREHEGALVSRGSRHRWFLWSALGLTAVTVMIAAGAVLRLHEDLVVVVVFCGVGALVLFLTHLHHVSTD